MLIAIVSNKESRGLHLDSLLLKDFLEGLGHSVQLWQYDEPQSESVELIIFCEVTVRQLVNLSKYPPWLIPNIEFLRDADLPVIRSSFGRVLAKTHEAHRICRELFGDDLVTYTGFLSRDRYLPDIPREQRFLHVAGHSRVKGTQAVVDAWRWSHNGKKLTAPLTVVCDFLKQEELPEHVTVLDGISDAELADLQNRCMFHLQPSMTEGFGHVLRESLSVRAFILTTAAPPMDEIKDALHIPATPARTFNQSQFYDVSAIDIHKAVADTVTMQRGFSISTVGREEFIAGNEMFKANFTALFDQFKPRVTIPWESNTSDALQIAFLGNFGPSFSTESELAWTFEHLGHEVVRIQENQTTAQQLRREALNADMFLWVHTHSFQCVTDEEMAEFLASLKQRGTVSVTFHLDKFWAIPEREVRIGRDQMWKTDFAFTADGGFQDEFTAAGVNHYWLPPGVVERGCHYGTPREEYRCDVGFVGAADGYHSQYPFRMEMVKYLRERYGERFRTFSGVREQALNDVYASVKILVGDSIFAGSPMYWSDRLPESGGRGAFIIFPKIEGMTIPVETYKPQDVDDLGKQIDFWLKQPRDRREIKKHCFEHVRVNDTYTQRLETILKIVGLR